MNLLQQLLGLGGSQPQKKQQQQTMPPDITYDPTGRTAYSARTPELAKLGNQYTANPTDPRFLGVDPAQFGYPADNTVAPYQPPVFGINQIHQLLGAANNPQANQLGGDYGTPIQGMQNPGYIPVQGSKNVRPMQAQDTMQQLPNRNARITW